jgi:toluene monooxygenase electron transfer component
MTCVHIDNGPSFGANSQDSLLKAALRAGVGFPYECSVGSCGSCKFELLEGEVATLWNEAPGLNARDRQRGKRLGCQSVPLSDIRVRVRTAPEYAAPILPCVVSVALVRKRTITHDMTEFTFKSSTPAEFLPGQYALMQLAGIGAQRAYSMSNLRNDEGLWQFIVRRVPNGLGTRHLHDELQVGDSLRLDGPYGLASLRPLERDVVCIAGGSGLAPMLSIARAAAPVLGAAGRRLHFFYGGRTLQDMAAAPLLAPLPGFGDRLCYEEAVSQAGSDDPGSGRVGFIHDVAEKKLGAGLADCEIYFAGPPPMVQATICGSSAVKRRFAMQRRRRAASRRSPSITDSRIPPRSAACSRRSTG